MKNRQRQYSRSVTYIYMVLACFFALWLLHLLMGEPHGFTDIAPSALCAGIGGMIGSRLSQ